MNWRTSMKSLAAIVLALSLMALGGAGSHSVAGGPAADGRAFDGPVEVARASAVRVPTGSAIPAQHAAGDAGYTQTQFDDVVEEVVSRPEEIQEIVFIRRSGQVERVRLEFYNRRPAMEAAVPSQVEAANLAEAAVLRGIRVCEQDDAWKVCR